MGRKESKLLTKQKRKRQVCRTIETKIQLAKLSIQTKTHLHTIFREAKWLYNYILSQPNIYKVNTKLKSVPVKVKDIFEQRELSHISAQMKQGLKERIVANIKILHSLKKKRLKVGRLRFKSRINSITLNQHHFTFTVFKEQNYIKLQGLKARLKVNGLEQLPEQCDIANAKLIRRDNNFYIQVTIFSDREHIDVPNSSVGIDFGCETQLALSNGIKVEYQVPVNKKIKRLDRKIMKQGRSKSKNKFKDQLRRRIAYRHQTNKRKDTKNKIVHVLTNSFKYVCFQDENLKGWQAGGHGKKMQSTGLGGIIAALERKAHTPLMVDRFFPSTQLCPICGEKTKHTQEQREYCCSFCGFRDDRDIKSAILIEEEGLKQLESLKLPMERRDVVAQQRKLEDSETSTLTLRAILNSIVGVNASFAGRVKKPHPLWVG
jgi:putative transposase